MYRIMVEELAGAPLRHSPVAASACRISALSSADYCLRGRTEVDRSSFSFRGNKQEIRRLFEAERLDGTGLDRLADGRDYRVLFRCRSWMDAQWSKAC